jgi:hypothetical protein
LAGWPTAEPLPFSIPDKRKTAAGESCHAQIDAGRKRNLFDVCKLFDDRTSRHRNAKSGVTEDRNHRKA